MLAGVIWPEEEYTLSGPVPTLSSTILDIVQAVNWALGTEGVSENKKSPQGLGTGSAQHLFDILLLT
jgi:hypothetical protein